MDIIIESTLKTLKKSRSLLEKISDKELCNTSISPYHSSIGSHVRHILDFYDCIFNKNSDNLIDLTARSRNRAVETKCCTALSYLSFIEEKLKTAEFNMSDTVIVIDDLGLGKIEMQYTMASLFSQANSHTIHHYAIINYILKGLNINFEDTDFGYNPTTPKATT
ncbi:hypothetical protein [Seonamhaeicola aphaedonensis]|uniref:DinB family protein n=1 Tax=Seonamhaeicola aphaedonensis TaxID=1461338 RepID=A0A3D9H9B4_9FLAO|nr:hypothetical protein [Seonamhaeicola aphaedonensis]RED46092.1 hypothetical protein DFQ02_107242 [Seonamhaeicola aphaedonensis]